MSGIYHKSLMEDDFNEESNMKKYIVIIIIIFIFTTVPFFYNFHENLNGEISNWSAFGEYFNGVLTPFLTIINIIVFVKISKAISDIDERRSDKEKQFQKELILMQFRKQEIDELNETLKKSLVLELKDNMLDATYPITYASTCLEEFLNTKLILFGLEEKDGLTQQIIHYHRLLQNLNSCFLQNKKIKRELTLDLLNTKNAIISGLQTIILEK